MSDENLEAAAEQTEMSYQPVKGGGKKWFVGCGVGCLAVIVAVCLLVWWGVRTVRKMIDEFKADGYAVVEGQELLVDEDIDVKQLFMGQKVIIKGDVATDIAVIAGEAEIHGRVEGTVYFRGQSLTIQPGAEVLGDLDVQAQEVTIAGKLAGEIKGEWQKLDDQRESEADIAEPAGEEPEPEAATAPEEEAAEPLRDAN